MKACARGSRLAVLIFAAPVLAFALMPAAPAAGQFVRPKSAHPLKVSLVPSSQTCTAPNRTHGPPLEFPSCDPPVPTSTAVTVGTPEVDGATDNSEGVLKLTVQSGIPGPPEDSDVIIQGSVSDVRCRAGTTACGDTNTAGGADYIGQLEANTIMRMTDRFNTVAPGGTSDSATVVDFSFPFPFTCVNSASTTIGGLCTASTSLNSLVAGAVKDGKRLVIGLGQAYVNDGGPDGDTTTTPNTQFFTQGVFVP
jgi:hypothetical protein